MLRALWGWGRETYGAIDTRSLGAFRVYLGMVLLYDLGRRVPYLALLYSNEGVLSNHFLLFHPQSEPQFSLLLTCSTVTEVRLAFAFCGLVYLAYLLGLWTRLMQCLALLCLVSLDQRNLFLEDGGIVVLLLLLSFTLFLPLGERYSLDALRLRWRLLRRPAFAPASPASSPRRLHSILVVGLTLQLASIYFFNLLHKSGATWRSGEAVHWVLWQNRIVTPLAVWLRLHEPSWFSLLSTRGTLLLEGLLPLLLLSPQLQAPSRRLGLLLALGLHLGIASLMVLGPFSYAMIGFWFLLLPVEDLLRGARWLGLRGAPPLEIFYDSSHPGARWLARLFATMVGREEICFTCNISPSFASTAKPSPSGHDSPPSLLAAQCFTWNMEAGSTEHATGSFTGSASPSLPIAPPAPACAVPVQSVGFALSCFTWNISPPSSNSMRLCSPLVCEGAAGVGDSRNEAMESREAQGFTCNIEGALFLVRRPGENWVGGTEAIARGLSGVPILGRGLGWLARGGAGIRLVAWAMSPPADQETRGPSPPFKGGRGGQQGRGGLVARELFGFALLTAILLQMSVSNRPVPRWLRIQPPEPLASLIVYPRLWQSWKMFAPEAPREDGILVVDALTADGRHLDPFTGERPDLEGLSRGNRGRGAPLCDYLFELHLEHNEPYLEELARFLAEWHAHGGRLPQDRLVSYKVWWVSHLSPPMGSLVTSFVDRSLVLEKAP